MKLTNVLVIGGGAAGLVAALASKSHFPNKNVMLIHKEEKEERPNSCQYSSSILESPELISLTDKGLEQSGIDVIINEVIAISTKQKKCVLKDYTEISYDKLVVATDSIPIVPDWLKGTHLQNVFTVPKHHKDLHVLIKKLKSFKNIVVIGAGFTGIEISTELKKEAKDITLIEVWPYILERTLDEDITKDVEKVLLECGIKILMENGITEIIGEKVVKAVKIEYADVVNLISADAVILAMGYEETTDHTKLFNFYPEPKETVG